MSNRIFWASIQKTSLAPCLVSLDPLVVQEYFTEAKHSQLQAECSLLNKSFSARRAKSIAN